MTPDTIPVYLQYGALGLLALVIVGAGYWLTWYTKEQQAVVRDLIDGQRVVNRDLMDRFDRLVDRFNTSVKEQNEDWKDLVRSCTDAQIATAAVLSHVKEGVAQEHKQRHQEHTQIMAAMK